MEHEIGDRDEQHEEHGQPQHQESELADAALERIAWPLHGQSMSKAAELGRATGADDEAGRHAADHGGAHAQEVASLPRLLDRSGEIDRVLLGRVGFSREQGLVDVEVAGDKKPAIAGHDVAGPELDHVPRHQPVDGDLHNLAVAEHLGLEPHGPAQGVDRILGPRLLDHVEHHAQQDDADDEGEARHLAGPGREAACEQENEDQRVGEAIENLAPQRPAAMEERVVRTVFGETPFDLSGAQALRRRPKLGEQAGQRQVPGQSLGHRCGLMRHSASGNVGYFQKDFTLAKSACAFWARSSS